MLALMTVAGGAAVHARLRRGGRRRAGRPRGRWGSACGRWASERALLCITHLPQIAAVAAGHFRIEKSADDEPPSPRWRRSRATAWSRSCAGCSAPSRPTRAPGATPRSCWRPSKGPPSSLVRSEPDPSMSETGPQTRFIFVTGASFRARQGHRVRLDRPPAARPRPLRRAPEVRPIHQRRPGHDEPVPARRGVRHRGRRRDRLDLGHYERFTDVNTTRASNATAGAIYDTVISRERRGDFLGGTVQVIPHITDEIKQRIRLVAEAQDVDVVNGGGRHGG